MVAVYTEKVNFFFQLSPGFLAHLEDICYIGKNGKEHIAMDVLVVVDMQNDFVSGALGTKEAFDIVPYVVGRVVEGVNRGETILFTRDTHGPDYPETQEGRKLPVPHCIRGSQGWEIIPQLQEYAAHPIDKPTFGSTVLGELLKARDEDLRRQGKPGVEKVTLIDVCTDICVLSNALLIKAFLPETEIVVEAACCAGVTPQSHETALSAMAACQITVLRP